MVSGKNNEAIDGFSKAIELEDTMLDVYFNRAIAYERIGEYAKAIGDYSTVILWKINCIKSFNGTYYYFSFVGKLVIFIQGLFFKICHNGWAMHSAGF